jgi:hypothetical protein
MSAFNSRVGVAGAALVLCAWLPGCGTPAAPQPPSLKLPDTVTDLAATRTGNQVTLTWTMPKRNTDKTPIKEGVTARICRRQGAGTCAIVGTDQSALPGKEAKYTETLPAAEASGDPMVATYFVELLNEKSRSAGLSNAAAVLIGKAPGVVDGLRAEVRKQGVVLTWTPDNEKAAVRLERKLLTPQVGPQSKSQDKLLAPAPEAVNQSLLVDAGTEQGRAIDKTVRFSETYEYRALRVLRVDVGGKTLELAGEVSAPTDVDVKDVFPPETPTGLAAVASAGAEGAGPSIDLNWEPNSEADLAGYVVYRREEGGAWEKASAGAPGIEPAFHDTKVQPGHTYHYAVSAVDKGGHESARSAEAEETVAQP